MTQRIGPEASDEGDEGQVLRRVQLLAAVLRVVLLAYQVWEVVTQSH